MRERRGFKKGDLVLFNQGQRRGWRGQVIYVSEWTGEVLPVHVRLTEPPADRSDEDPWPGTVIADESEIEHVSAVDRLSEIANVAGRTET